MKTSDFVFELINSLSKNEASLVVTHLKNLGTEHSKLQLQLFKHARLARTTDSESIRQRLPSEELKAYFSYHKGALKNHILQVIRNLEADDQIVFQNQVVNELDTTMVLYNRGFEQEAIRHLDKLVKKVDSRYDACLRLHVLNQKHRLLKRIPTPNRPELLEAVNAERKATLHLLENEIKYDKISGEVHYLYLSARQSGDSSFQTKLKDLLDSPVLKNVENTLSFNSELNFRMCEVFRCSLEGNVKNQVKKEEEIVGLWRRHASYQKRRPFEYQYSLINLLNGYCKARKTDNFERLYKEAISIKGLNKKERAAGRVALISCKLYYLLNTATAKRVVAFAKQIQTETSALEKHAIPGSVINLRYNIACVLFVSGETNFAEDALRKIIENKSILRKDIQGAARVLLKLSCYGTKDSEYLHSLNMACRRFFRSNEILDKMQGITFRMIDKLLNYPKSEHRKVFQDELRKLQELQDKNPTHLGIEEVMLWVLSKINNKPIREVWESERKVDQ